MVKWKQVDGQEKVCRERTYRKHPKLRHIYGMFEPHETPHIKAIVSAMKFAMHKLFSLYFFGGKSHGNASSYCTIAEALR